MQATSWCVLLLFLCLFTRSSRGAQAGLFLADTYDEHLTWGQLTVSPFDLGGGSLGPNQTCLVVTGDPPFPVVQLAPCSSSLDTNSLADKWAYNYSSDTFQSWGAASFGNGSLMCLDAQSLDSNQGSLFTKTYLRANPCDSSALQKWVWNGTTIKLANTTLKGLPDYWVAYTEPFFALTTFADRAQSFTFVIPKDDASDTAEPCTKCNIPVSSGGCKCDKNCDCKNSTAPPDPCAKCNLPQSSGGCKCDNMCNCLTVYSPVLLPSSSTKVAAIVAATVGGSIGALCLVSLIVGYFCWKRRTERPRRVLLQQQWSNYWWLSGSRGLRKPSFDAPSDCSGRDTFSPGVSHPGGRRDALQEWYNFEYKELFTATNGFGEENVLGRGGWSTVYKGTLESGAVVAVKVMGSSFGSASQSNSSFEREVSVMGRIRQKNLVSLRGCLRKGSSKIIVLDYCENGSLADALAGKGPFLDWPTRLRVAEDAARGINYLHNDIVPACLHRDIKPANILLNGKVNALVADFGLAKHMTEGDATQVETRLAGTFGFMAPECLMTGNATKAGDVFAFGGVLLVMITGRPIFLKQSDGTIKSLAQWILDRTHLEDPREYADPSLDSHYSSDEIGFPLRLALSCVANKPEFRPTMATVLRLLTELRGGKSPAKLRGELPVSEDWEYESSVGSYYISPTSNSFFSRSSGSPSEHAMTIIDSATGISEGR